MFLYRAGSNETLNSRAVEVETSQLFVEAISH